MVKTNRIKGIIFDMDNTLLQSNINFSAMRAEIYQYLIETNLLTKETPIDEHTASTLIELAKQTGADDLIYKQLMEIATKHEVIGMEGAGLEPGVHNLLEEVQNNYV